MIHSAGDGPEGRSNRRINFQHTITKSAIPHDFLQRIGSAEKPTLTNSAVETLKRNESTSSLDSAPNKSKGYLMILINIPHILLFV